MSWAADPLLRAAPVVFDARAIERAIDRIADAATARLATTDPVVIPVMIGGLPFGAALLARLAFHVTIDYAHVSRYRGGVKGGALRWLRAPQVPLAGRTVLLVDDVLDDGDTLVELKRWCADAGAAHVEAAVLVRKASQARPDGVDADYIGLEAGREFLFGFGMDLDERYRHLPEIRALPEETA